MQVDTEILKKLQSIAWFSQCGRPPDGDLTADIKWIHDWSTATKCFSNPHWEHTTFEARNALTAYLHSKHPNAYSEWNKVTREAKARLEETVFPIVLRFQKEHQLDQTFVNCVKWDILAAVMEASYRSCRPSVFFGNLLMIYEHGRFPCGWLGDWPNGQLLVI
jgi:hypothetical protein